MTARVDAATTAPPPGITARTVAFAAALALAFAGFVSLGVWQLQRMQWKQALIARVEARVDAAPVAPPTRGDWAAITSGRDEYRRVRLSGRFLPVAQTRTQAVTALGAGWWLLAPLRMDNGEIVLVNRGFVPAGEDAAPPPTGTPTGTVQIEGLLRISEPAGGFLRRNLPEQDRWYSRDVAAIARARGLPADAVAPFFVDAVRDPALNGWPRGGLTVVAFRDSHLSYALTWFGMALLTAVAGLRLSLLVFVKTGRLRQDRRGRGVFDHAGPISRG
jgi:surfeit locus 1 family protein